MVYSSYIADNTLQSCNRNLGNVFANIKWDSKNVLEWFKISALNKLGTTYPLGTTFPLGLTFPLGTTFPPCSKVVKH